MECDYLFLVIQTESRSCITTFVCYTHTVQSSVQFDSVQA